MRKIPLLCCAAVARVCKQRLRAGFQTKGFPEDNITKSGMYLRILWRDFVKPPTEKPFALESNFLVRLCFFVTKGKEEPFRGGGCFDFAQHDIFVHLHDIVYLHYARPQPHKVGFHPTCWISPCVTRFHLPSGKFRCACPRAGGGWSG